MSVFSKFAGLKPGRSVFNLSHTKLFNTWHGWLIPVCMEEMIPGDMFKIGNEMVVRLQPMIAPMLHEVNVYVHYFFVPYRVLWPEPNGWETFITGGKSGDETPTIPRWDPGIQQKYSLWDYMCFPITPKPVGALPLDFPRRAYNLIFNEYLRSQDLTPEVDLTNEVILKRGWEKDYFTSCLPYQQRGTPPALPISGSSVWANPVTGSTGYPAITTGTTRQFAMDQANSQPFDAFTKNALEKGVPSIPTANMNANTLTSATFDTTDLRLVVQIQKFMERNMRAGARYKEQILAHYGVNIGDARLQRPEFIGGTKSPIIVSEVLQTSETQETGTAQGTMAGHGITADSQRVNKYYAREFGILMGLMSIMPRSAYSQGIDKQWLRETKYDFYFPEFAHLSEQAVFMSEVYAQDTEVKNKTIFGYQGRYNEMRYRPSRTMADMRASGLLGYWNLSREFAAAPSLNDAFIECNGATASQMRVFAVQDEPPFVVHFANRITAIRPMPKEAMPGLMDHF